MRIHDLNFIASKRHFTSGQIYKTNDGWWLPRHNMYLYIFMPVCDLMWSLQKI